MSRLLLPLALVLLAGCSEPPQKEIDQAQTAVDAARTAGADKYAADEYTGAAATLQKARTAVDQRDYRQALSYAIDARQRAIEAAKLVVEAKAREKTEAERAFKTETDRVTRLETLLREAETARAPVQQLRTARAAIEAARTSLQEAGKLLDAGNDAEAATALAEVRGKVDVAARETDALPQHGKSGKRRH